MGLVYVLLRYHGRVVASSSKAVPSHEDMSQKSSSKMVRVLKFYRDNFLYTTINRFRFHLN